ncbi:hypothetical protein C448_09822 [Halococcus morrhuae DSM 1307]|uniref:Uncharacterized protein n=1 Tax=Halococcus morrhuae DSM 1307 TaxID=931277 RepID=M0MDT0_HALMO|nr:hypothetical protein C448_09822 [Halococcus morrhuae DSM 1307]
MLFEVRDKSGVTTDVIGISVAADEIIDTIDAVIREIIKHDLSIVTIVTGIYQQCLVAGPDDEC